MLNRDELNGNAAEGNELGTILCKRCGEILDTVPTNGVKTFYMTCGKPECEQTSEEVNVE